jgi:hypothetical protein
MTASRRTTEAHLGDQAGRAWISELREENYRLGDETGGWFGIHRFLGLYVVNSTQYGEGQDLFGPFAKRKEANAIFNLVVVLDTPPA